MLFSEFLFKQLPVGKRKSDHVMSSSNKKLKSSEKKSKESSTSEKAASEPNKAELNLAADVVVNTLMPYYKSKKFASKVTNS